jgi:hypothetical protein
MGSWRFLQYVRAWTGVRNIPTPFPKHPRALGTHACGTHADHHRHPLGIPHVPSCRVHHATEEPSTHSPPRWRRQGCPRAVSSDATTPQRQPVGHPVCARAAQQGQAAERRGGTGQACRALQTQRGQGRGGTHAGALPGSLSSAAGASRVLQCTYSAAVCTENYASPTIFP